MLQIGVVRPLDENGYLGAKIRMNNSAKCNIYYTDFYHNLTLDFPNELY